MRTDVLLPFPFNLAGRFQVDNASSQKSSRWEENDESYTLTTVAVGLSEDEIVLEVENRSLILKMEGSHKLGAVSRHNQWTLPNDADVNNVQASLNRGILTVVVARLEKPQNTRIEIKNMDQVSPAPTAEETQQ